MSATAPSNWPKPNYINPETQGISLQITAISFMIISTVIVGLRIYVRRVLIRSWRCDDILMVLAVLPAIAMTTATILGCNHGWGYHIWDLRLEWIRAVLLSNYLSELLFVIAVALTKLSILCSYLRISTSKKFTRVIRGTMVFTVVFSVVFFIVVTLRCKPISNYWTRTHENACMSETGTVLTYSVINCLADLLIVLMPVPTLLKLRLPARQKFVVIGLMTLGVVICVAAVVRVQYLNTALNKTYDYTWVGYDVWIWADVECFLGIICPSIATLRPLVKTYFPDQRSGDFPRCGQWDKKQPSSYPTYVSTMEGGTMVDTDANSPNTGGVVFATPPCDEPERPDSRSQQLHQHQPRNSGKLRPIYQLESMGSINSFASSVGSETEEASMQQTGLSSRFSTNLDTRERGLSPRMGPPGFGLAMGSRSGDMTQDEGKMIGSSTFGGPVSYGGDEVNRGIAYEGERHVRRNDTHENIAGVPMAHLAAASTENKWPETHYEL